MKKLVLAALLVVLSMALGACSQGSQGASNQIKVTMTDFHFTPDTFTVPAGKEISFSGRNNGAVAHDFIIMKLGTDAGDSFDAEDEPNVFWKTEIQPGQTDQETITAPSDPGEYQVICGIPGHLQAGMTAKLIVTP